MSTDEITCTGVLEMHPKGYGFLRETGKNFRAGAKDV